MSDEERKEQDEPEDRDIEATQDQDEPPVEGQDEQAEDGPDEVEEQSPEEQREQQEQALDRMEAEDKAREEEQERSLDRMEAEDRQQQRPDAGSHESQPDAGMHAMGKPEAGHAMGQPDTAMHAQSQPDQAHAMGHPDPAHTQSPPEAGSHAQSQPEPAHAMGQPEPAHAIGQPDPAHAQSRPEPAHAMGQPNPAHAHTRPEPETHAQQAEPLFPPRHQEAPPPRGHEPEHLTPPREPARPEVHQHQEPAHQQHERHEAARKPPEHVDGKGSRIRDLGEDPRRHTPPAEAAHKPPEHVDSKGSRTRDLGEDPRHRTPPAEAAHKPPEHLDSKGSRTRDLGQDPRHHTIPTEAPHKHEDPRPYEFHHREGGPKHDPYRLDNPHIKSQRDMAHAVFDRYDTDHPIAIVPVKGQDHTYVVLLSGTEPTNVGQATTGPEDAAASLNHDDRYRQSIMTALKEAGIQKSDNLIIAGHSLGGMEAQNIVTDKEFKEKYTASEVVTFGSPKTAPEQNGVTYSRYTTIGDPIPNLSPGAATHLDYGRQVEVSDNRFADRLKANAGNYEMAANPTPAGVAMGGAINAKVGIDQHMSYPNVKELDHYQLGGKDGLTLDTEKMRVFAARRDPKEEQAWLDRDAETYHQRLAHGVKAEHAATSEHPSGSAEHHGDQAKKPAAAEHHDFFENVRRGAGDLLQKGNDALEPLHLRQAEPVVKEWGDAAGKFARDSGLAGTAQNVVSDFTHIPKEKLEKLDAPVKPAPAPESHSPAGHAPEHPQPASPADAKAAERRAAREHMREKSGASESHKESRQEPHKEPRNIRPGGH